MGIQKRKEGQTQAANEFFARALEVHPEYADAHGWMGRLAYERNDFKNARRHLQISIDLNTVHVQTMLFLGLTLSQLGHGPEAVQTLTRAANIAPTNVEITRDLGIVLYQNGHIESSINRLKEAQHMAEVHLWNQGKLDHVRFSLAMAILGKGGWDANKQGEAILQSIAGSDVYSASVKHVLQHISTCTNLPSNRHNKALNKEKRTKCRAVKVDLPLRI